MKHVRRVTSLEFNIANMRIGGLKIGSSAWRRALYQQLPRFQFNELEGVRLVRGIPHFLHGADNSLRKLWNASRTTNPKRMRRGSAPKFSRRILKALSVLQKCPGDCLHFVTVVSAIGTTKEHALELVEVEGARLDRFIRNRFTNAKWIMFPEVDLLLAEKVASGLIMDRSWRETVTPRTLIYKVHFHGILYVPNQGSRRVEDGFRRYESGRMVKHYSGANQVRVLPLDDEPGTGQRVPDVIGVAGYSTKKHFRPPFLQRMYEGFPEWVWLNDKLHANDRFVRIGGMNSPVVDYCRRCDTYFEPSSGCGCEALFERDDFFEDGSEINQADQLISSLPTLGQWIESTFGSLPLSLNWVELSRSIHLKKCVAMEKIGHCVQWLSNHSKRWLRPLHQGP